MNNDMLKVSTARLILVRELAEGPKMHKQLRLAYFGEGRAAGNAANTSFYNKLKAALADGLVKKTAVGMYELDTKGLEMLTFVREQKMDLTAVKSEAQVRWEMEHPQA